MTAAPRREAPPPAAVLEAIRAPFRAFGGVWTAAPVLQPLTALLDLLGEALRTRLFVVQSEGGEEWALRPDFTIALARTHIASGDAAGRRLYEGEAFRNPPRGSERPSEFVQVGVESFGEAGDPIVQDAEIAALAWTAARAGGRTDLTLHLGDMALFAAFLDAVGLPEPTRVRLARAFERGRPLGAELARLAAPHGAPAASGLSRLLTDLPEPEAVSVLEELWGLAAIQPVGGRDAREIVHRLALRAEALRAPGLGSAEIALVRDYLAIEATPAAALAQVEALVRRAGGVPPAACASWARRLDAMTARGIAAEVATFATAMVRPFGYYDGLLFEVRSAALAPDEAVAAGGRLDGLLARLGGPAHAAVGCMVRPGRAWSGVSK